MKIPMVTLTTDFGLKDPFVGIMKGIILSLAPQANIVDLTHNIPPQGVAEAALVLKQSSGYFPKQTLHAVLVDPGVGSNREIMLVRTPSALFLAPDNGVLTYVLEGVKILSAWQVNNSHYFLQPVSRTFHGRDIFAPVIGHLMRGVSPSLVGGTAGAMQLLPALPSFRQEGGVARGIVLSADHFGNLLTNLPHGPFSSRRAATVLVKGRFIPAISPNYAAVPPNTLGAVWSSTGSLEVFLRNGSAAAVLDARIGDEVVLTLPED